ncbi:MAG: Asp-tRNA(Asn)/Glu-tRNA(Gln) amidotransferase subunit GatA [Armatimonadetes bacterium]|nr:Asp-tRNA(Asn)/Glu-tRNA(Gln) amidotransferase subunit GatA [Armatimonadota bacterium]NIM23328.1 Asp-tRNA(Asn)/Glu-tRNA(Gln) amidotransferase subunit GatA [Armatimonadota bacterium]NIM67192.1 Asp-tRNA(Asn)/Glu-tRNA(Gln) amidotransferase subunit GatA [Armatimonadota bacterium]NIM75717.1 Asp-tRNA(Asn)/Glu-tRNA(Gln) amidotransferase subunit GatA [Armatimonadota bacterium]NIN05381.1 Asp-tRNA(Asn)/Glu-tRNA(Gln) amidotransferase subunit GatA [Armatimonadota bacterium]
MELTELTAHEVHELLTGGQVSCREVTEAVLARAEQVEPLAHSYIRLTPEIALAQADEIDQRLARGESLPPLGGIPLALKDIMCTKGLITTCGSKILEDFIPPYDATIVTRCYEQGMVLVGKTNMDEFAMGSSTENSAFGPTHNPWDIERVPGGSSGGSASATAANEAIMALGSDTGGSIRQPAALCGVVGMKPTYGRVSRQGLVAFASSLDQIGPITKDVTDCAHLLNVICGHDPLDSTSVDIPVPDFAQALGKEIKGLKIGLPKEFFEYEGKEVGEEVQAPIRAALKIFESLGAEIEETSLPSLSYCVATYYLIAPAEASSNLARYDGVQYGFRAPGEDIVDMYRKTRDQGFGAEVKRRIMLGTYALSAGYYDAYYQKAQQVRTLMVQDFQRAFEKYDVLMGPTSPTVAFRLGERTADPLAMYLSDVCTIPMNLAGLPAISVPCGFSDGLPVGLQIVGRTLDEETLLRAAHAFEQSTRFHSRRNLPASKDAKALVERRGE